MSTTNPTAEQLRQEIDQQRDALGRDFEALGDHVSPGRMIERKRMAAGERVRSVKTTLMGAADHSTSRVGDARSAVANQAGAVANAVTSAPDMALQRTQGSPLVMGLISFGLGFVAGSVIPATQREQELASQAEPLLERAAEGAGQVARESIDELAPVAQRAAESLKEDAAEGARVVQERAKEGVTEVQAQARSGASEVADQARPSS
ncbi:MAG: DUF3618 domain-containing protein [Acidimicrobiales bacterium]